MTEAAQQQPAPKTTRRILHLQVAGNPSMERLQEIVQSFNQALIDNQGAIIGTDSSVTCFNIDIPSDDPFTGIQVRGSTTPETIAAAAYEINRTYSISLGEADAGPYAFAPDTVKQSIRDGVQLLLRNPNITPAETHNAWLQARVNAGWVYGAVKDAEAKTHPNLLPFEALSVAQRTKDAFFATTVKSLRGLLPLAQPVSRHIELWVAATEQWIPGDFMTLQPGYTWRFKDDVQAHLAQSSVFVNYTEEGTYYAVQSAPINQQPAPTEPEDEKAAESVFQDDEYHHGSDAGAEVDKQEALGAEAVDLHDDNIGRDIAGATGDEEPAGDSKSESGSDHPTGA